MSANIYDWSTTAANNSNSDGDLTWAEGQAPSTVNNSARVMMQRVKQLLVDIGGSIAAGGTANGLTVTASNAFTAYADGMVIAFRATASNSAAATLNVNGIGAKAIQKMDSTGDVALVANEIRNTGVYVAQYSAALNGAAGAWLLLNPTLSSALYALAGLVTVDNTVPRFDGLVGKIQTSGVVIDDSNNVKPPTNDGGALGVSGTAWADVFLASGGVLNWNAGNYTVTHAAGLLTASGALTVNGALIGGTTANFTGIITAAGGISVTSGVINFGTGGTGNVGTSSGGTSMVVYAAGGSCLFRPNGSASSSGQFVVAATGNATVNGTLTVTG